MKPYDHPAFTHRRVDLEQDVAADPGLKLLFVSARRLIDALEARADSIVLGERVTTYVRSAVACGISRVVIESALECLVHDHAAVDGSDRSKRIGGQRRQQATAPVLAFVLRLVATEICGDCGGERLSA